MINGVINVARPNREIAMPVAFLRLATKNNPTTKSKIPKANIPIAIGFIIPSPCKFSDYVNDHCQLMI